MFRDRIDAGRRLAEELVAYADDSEAIVLGIPRGGVIVAAEVAERLGLPLDVLVTSKIGAPDNPEFAVGAVAPDGSIIANPYAGYSEAQLEHLARSVRERVASRAALYRGEREPLLLRGATTILVDDGVATGLTTEAAVRYLRASGSARIVLAVPVIAADAARRLSELVDELVAVEVPELFYAVGQYYRHFDQTSDDEVLDALADAENDETYEDDEDEPDE